jgi:hypothetical protein
MSTFFHKSFAVAERKTLTLDDITERVAGAIEHPFVAARSYVKDAGLEWVQSLLTTAGRRRLDRHRKVPYRWEAGATCTEAAKVFFVALYRPGFLPAEKVIEHFGEDLGRVVLDMSSNITNEELIPLFDLPTEGVLYKVASVIRSDEKYAELPRRREWSATEEQAQQIYELLEQRQSYSAIAKQMGATVQALREHVRLNGLSNNPPGRRPKSERNEKICEEYRQGTPPRVLAERYEISTVRVHQILRIEAPSRDIDTYKARVRSLLSRHPNVTDEVKCAIQTLLAWAKE